MHMKNFWATSGPRSSSVMVIVALGLERVRASPTRRAGDRATRTPRPVQALNADRAAQRPPAAGLEPEAGEQRRDPGPRQMSRVGQRSTTRTSSALISSPSYAGYRAMGENILVGPGSMSAPSIETAWMNSPPHRANILSGAFNVVGIGYFRGPDGRIWAVQEFGGV